MDKLSRREFVHVSTLAVAGAVASACATTPEPSTPEQQASPTPSAKEQATAKPKAEATAPPVEATAGKEAPMLGELVGGGQLPPVEERLPSNPLALEVVEEIGQFGGNWRRAYRGVSDRWGPTKLLEEYGIEFRQEPNGPLTTTPSMWESWEVSSGGDEYTVHMRQGIRWSDGELHTTDDVQFWYDDILLNKDLTPAAPDYMRLGGEVMQLDVIDDYTYKVTFAAPAPLIPITVAKRGGGLAAGPTFSAPAHYLQDFHPGYVSEADLQQVMKEKGVDTWANLYGDGPIDFWFSNPEKPLINAWYMKVPPPADRIVMERNPYYWQVDPEGNQLPYIDTVAHDFFDSSEVLNLKIINGEIDCQERHTDVANYTLYKENEEKGDYRIITWVTGESACYYPNLATPDEMFSELFNDVRFRHALSVAINREEINQLVHLGQQTIRQSCPIPGSGWYDEEWEKKWTEYDPDTSNQLLDDMGLTERDGSGFRLSPDGKQIAFGIEHRWASDSATAAEVRMVAKFWQDIGINAAEKQEERSLLETRQRANEMLFHFWEDTRESLPMADLAKFIGSHWADEWLLWYNSGGSRGLEPPEGHWIRDIWDNWDKTQIEPDEEKRNAYFQTVMDICKEQLPKIGTVGMKPALFITRNNFRNVPSDLIQDDTPRGIGIAQPAQFFFKQSQ